MTDAMNIESIKAVKREYSSFLTSLPHVQSVGVGPKVQGGRQTGEMSIKVYVDRKVKPEELALKERVPPELDGVPTDVEVIDKLRAR